MRLYPVIMCGGAGTRLWPSSRPARPKQFMPLTGDRSLFQETALRVADLCDGGTLVVVAGVSHREAIAEQLAALGLNAQLLLEPEARDSAAAMAAAAAWTLAHDPDAINVFVASDHHIPDAGAFVTAVRHAASAAAEGRIVTLGVTPTEPASAYGYIAPSGTGLARIRAFVEKPDRATAARYMEQGYLWNSGNFIAASRTLIEELQRHAPGVVTAVQAALDQARSVGSGGAGEGGVLTLGPAFRGAPRISIDYAVMEKTDRASVLAVDFAWSDLGAWDSVAATGQGAAGAAILEDAPGCLVRAPDGVMVAALGVQDLAIIVEADAVMVCPLSRSQEVKTLVERLRSVSPRHLDFVSPAPEGLAEGGRRFADWLRLRALPLWSTLGQDGDGAFAERLGLDGRPALDPRRARVQARQIHVFAEAGRLGWAGPWSTACRKGQASLEANFLRPDGRMRTRVSAMGEGLDETAMLYDQAFLLLALAGLEASDPTAGCEARATALRDGLLAEAPATGGLIEAGSHPWQSNAHMHLLEACLAWEQVGSDPAWPALADRVVDLALERFIDPDLGCLREFFAPDWSPAPGDDGRRVEPGHQFEWAWLLVRHARLRGDEAGLVAARRLYACGRRGVDPARGLALDALDETGGVVSPGARLWPQTEWLKAALILAEEASGPEREALLIDAASALRALHTYLTPEGLWRDKGLVEGGFVDEPAPASSLYHILGAFTQLADTGRALELAGLEALTLR
ncbi:AGE family epimerase/isomerase [Brevundimonas sp. R86498]|uniref:AGE family epimerase/isomerase n=1 Tax=Brevundimonas sp. R86498 TaxID=3093845 RepID=UPI0037C90BD6